MRRRDGPGGLFPVASYSGCCRRHNAVVCALCESWRGHYVVRFQRAVFNGRCRYEVRFHTVVDLFRSSSRSVSSPVHPLRCGRVLCGRVGFSCGVPAMTGAEVVEFIAYLVSAWSAGFAGLHHHEVQRRHEPVRVGPAGALCVSGGARWAFHL